MKAVVLVGGEGTRLRPLTETTPKPLLPLMNRPFLHHVLDHLAAHGVNEAILSSPYLLDAFAPFIAERTGDPAITWITEAEPLGTGGAVLNALDAVGDEAFFVLNGDILTDLDLSAMAASHRERRAAVSIATMRVDDARPFGLIVGREDGGLIEFREKPEDLVPGDINAGTYLVEPEALAGFPNGVNASIERETFPAIIERGDRVFAFPEQCYWMDLGTPANYLQAHFDLLEGKMSGQPKFPAPLLARGVKTDVRSHLGRWVVAGEGAVVGPEAELENSVLHAEVRVSRDAKVESSILGAGSRVGRGATVSGSVVAAGALVEDGANVKDAKVPAPA